MTYFRLRGGVDCVGEPLLPLAWLRPINPFAGGRRPPLDIAMKSGEVGVVSRVLSWVIVSFSFLSSK